MRIGMLKKGLNKYGVEASKVVIVRDRVKYYNTANGIDIRFFGIHLNKVSKLEDRCVYDSLIPVAKKIIKKMLKHLF